MKRNLGKLLAGIGACFIWSGLACVVAILMVQSVNHYRSPLASQPPQPGAPTGELLTRRVVVVLIDGLRDDTSRDSDVMPFLNSLRGQWASATMRSREPSRSQTGYAVLFTGGWCEVSDAPPCNLPADEIYAWTADNLFAAAHRHGLKTAISGLFWFERGLHREVLDASFFAHTDDAAADAAIVEAGTRFLQKSDYQFVLIHLLHVDTAGHKYGARSSEWTAAARKADGHLKQIVGLLDLSQDTLLVVSDHGHIDRGGHGGGELAVITEPFVLAGNRIVGGDYGQVQMIDVAPTLAALLGVNIPASSQGRVLTNLLLLSPGQMGRIEKAVTEQQLQLAAAYQAAIRFAAPAMLSTNAVHAAQAQMELARAVRQNQERLWRLIPALLLAAVPGILLDRRRGAGWLVCLAGSAAYAGLFHLVYFFVAKRGYSFSGYSGAGALLLLAFGITALTFIPAWLLVSVAAKTHKHATGDFAETSLAMMLISLYLLSFSMIVSLAFNGLTYPWALPEFRSLFLAVLSAAQMLSVTVIGTVLVAVALVFSKAIRRW